MSDEKKTDQAPKQDKAKSGSNVTSVAHKRDTKRIEREIERWFRERIHGSPIARSTEHFNFLHEAVRDLKHRLIKE